MAALFKKTQISSGGRAGILQGIAVLYFFTLPVQFRKELEMKIITGVNVPKERTLCSSYASN